MMWLGGRRGSNGPETHGKGHRVYKCGWERIRRRRESVANPPLRTTGARCEALGSQGGPREDLEFGGKRKANDGGQRSPVEERWR